MEYGKFNSAEELLRGYEELEKSFTRKCQQLSELQSSGISGEPSPQGTHETEGVASSVANDATAVPAPENDAPEEHRPNATPVPPRVMTGGGNVSAALPNRPKTLREASELAKKYFN